jgi:PKHD-type hydroxylase
MKVDPLYWEFPKALSPALCNLIVQEGMELPSLPGKTGGDTEDDAKETSARDSAIAWMDENHWVTHMLRGFILSANRQAWNFDVDKLPATQFTSYGLNQHYKLHMDTFALKSPMRKLSIVAQLSDPASYEGGEFFFDWAGERFSPANFKAQGSIIVFPSFVTHEVTPMTKGTRHSIVNWMQGPALK